MSNGLTFELQSSATRLKHSHPLSEKSMFYNKTFFFVTQKDPVVNLNFGFYFCNEVVYPTHHNFIFFRTAADDRAFVTAAPRL